MKVKLLSILKAVVPLFLLLLAVVVVSLFFYLPARHSEIEHEKLDKRINNYQIIINKNQKKINCFQTALNVYQFKLNKILVRFVSVASSIRLQVAEQQSLPPSVRSINKKASVEYSSIRKNLKALGPQYLQTLKSTGGKDGSRSCQRHP